MKLFHVLADVIAGPMILLSAVPVIVGAVLIAAVVAVTVIIIRKRRK